MRYEFEFDYSDDLVRAGAKRAIRHQFGGKAAVTLAVVLAVVVATCMLDHAEYMCGLLQGAFGLLVILLVMTALSAQERALKYARKLPTRKARCVITDESITMENALATSMLHWPLVESVVRAPDVWLFFLSKEQLFVLPADRLAAEVGAFIEGRVTAAGGKMQ